jgi:Uma2 family endonuclease
MADSRALAGEEPLNVPSELIYEMDEGKPVYYRGYREVINGVKSLEQVMGSSLIQSLVIKLVQEFFDRRLGATHKALSNELGLQFEKKSWRNADIAVYSLAQLRRHRREISDKYASFPPEIVVEIDTKADLEQGQDILEYAFRKTQQLLDFGADQVIWLFTAGEKFMHARPGHRWEIGNWDEDLEIREGLVLNVGRLLDEFEQTLEET